MEIHRPLISRHVGRQLGRAVTGSWLNSNRTDQHIVPCAATMLHNVVKNRTPFNQHLHPHDSLFYIPFQEPKITDIPLKDHTTPTQPGSENARDAQQ